MEKLDVGKLQEDKIVNGLRPGLSKGDLFADGGFIYKIKAVNENGTYFSEREDLENTVFADEEIVSTEQVLNTETNKETDSEEKLLPDASKDQQEENENQEPENVDLETLSFKELKEKAISLGFHFKVGQGKEKLIEYIKSVSKN